MNIKGGILNLEEKDISINNPYKSLGRYFHTVLENKELVKMNYYISYIFDIFIEYYKMYNKDKIPTFKNWISTREKRNPKKRFYISLKKELIVNPDDEEHKKYIGRVLLCYRDFKDYAKLTDRSMCKNTPAREEKDDEIIDLVHISLNDYGSMHMSFTNFDFTTGKEEKIHIFSKKSPMKTDGISDIIEFIEYIKDNILNDDDNIYKLIQRMIHSRNSTWYKYFIEIYRIEVSKLQTAKKFSNIDETAKIIFNRFRELYKCVLTRFIKYLKANADSDPILGNIKHTIIPAYIPSPDTLKYYFDDSTTGGPITSSLVTGGPASSGPASSGPATGGPASSGPATGRPASSGPASSGSYRRRPSKR